METRLQLSFQVKDLTGEDILNLRDNGKTTSVYISNKRNHPALLPKQLRIFEDITHHLHFS